MLGFLMGRVRIEILNRGYLVCSFSGLVLKAKDKEKEELTETMNKLHIEGSSSGSGLSNFKRKPVIILVVGMAGDCFYLIEKPNGFCLVICSF